MPTLRVPGLLAHQQRVAQTVARYKLLCWGRRAAKSITALSAAVEGHGPTQPNGQPLYPGLLNGVDILWIGRSLDQARIIWAEQVRPRFLEAGAYVNDTLMVAQLYGHGRLIVRSQDRDSINNARGMGARIGGVICDEVAHWDDAESVWLDVLVPLMLDNMAWAMFTSTTKDDSWFNNQCDRVAANDPTISSDWALFEATAQNNPVITPAAFAALLAEYSPEDPRLAREVYAKRLHGGAGLAFPEWNKDVHVLPWNVRVPDEWRWVAGFDYGYTNGGHLGLWACGPDREVWLMWELRYKELSPELIGTTIGEAMPQYGQLPEWIGSDSALWDPGPTIPEAIQKALNAALGQHRVPLVSVPKGRNSRVTSKALVHELLRYERDADGKPVPWAPPRLRVHPRCAYWLATVPSIPRDPKNSEDTDPAYGDDHALDATRYMLMCRQPLGERAPVAVPQDVHPGYYPDGSRKPRYQDSHTDGEEMRIMLEQQGVNYGGRYGGRPR